MIRIFTVVTPNFMIFITNGVITFITICHHKCQHTRKHKTLKKQNRGKIKSNN
jgi:heme/copper-type cytochrome/quinol oxidase subunit 2